MARTRSANFIRAGSKFVQAMKLTKGRGGAPCCDRKAVLKGVKRGLSPADAVAKFCPSKCAR